MSQSQQLASSPKSIAGLLRDYRRSEEHYDELYAAPGQLRAPWEKFASCLTRLGNEGISERAEHARRLLRENGVTYNAVGAPQGPDRPWELDPIPLLLSAGEWDSLAAGLSQRAVLLNALLDDLYGPQRTLAEGILPPAAVYGNPLYWFACRQTAAKRGRKLLVLHGCNLARRVDGSWCVLADRTQGPSGAGYALENRIVMSRTLPHDFESLHIRRLAGFFSCLRDSLREMAPEETDNPRVVLLSPGPTSSRYFEDGYLARYLGYTLAEGGDLTVRGERTYLKTLGGLLPVDVILRRVLDGDCDPLELRPDGAFGSPGILQSSRSGKLVVANAVGAGVLESPIFHAYLPQICRFLLGEELRLQSKPIWWCGDREGMDLLRRNFDSLLLCKAFVHRYSPVIEGRKLTAEEREEIIGRVAAAPEQWVVRGDIGRSVTPSWNGTAITPARFVLRTFAAAHGESYQVLPGGLCRVSPISETVDCSASSGRASKDVWIISDRPVPSITLLPVATSAVELRRSGNDVPSRVADHMFWLGRYSERAEAFARHLRSCIVRFTNDLEPTNLQELSLLVRALEDSPPVSNAADEPTSGNSPEAISRRLLEFTYRDDLPGSLAQLLGMVRRAAGNVRDRFSVDGWRIVNQLETGPFRPEPEDQAPWGETLLLLNQTLGFLAAFSGIGTESMTRGPSWRFLDMGRRIERALQIMGIVRRSLVTAGEYPTAILEAVLEIADSSMTYRHRYLASLQLAPVLDLILIDETNPRAVGFQLNALSEHVDALPSSETPADRSNEQRLMHAAQAALRLTDVDALTERDSEGRRMRLESFLLSLEERLRLLSEGLNHRYLSHTAPTRRLGAIRTARGGNA